MILQHARTDAARCSMVWQEWTMSKRPPSSAASSMRAWISSVRGRPAQELATAFVGFDGGQMVAFGAASRKRARSCRDWSRHPAARARVQIGMARESVHRGLGAKTFAVAHIAPVGAARYGGAMARLGAVDARQALHQAAMIAEIDFQAARRTFRLIDQLERIAAAEIARHRAWNGPGKIPVTIFGRSALIIHYIFGACRHSPDAPSCARDGLETAQLLRRVSSRSSGRFTLCGRAKTAKCSSR